MFEDTGNKSESGKLDSGIHGHPNHIDMEFHFFIPDPAGKESECLRR